MITNKEEYWKEFKKWKRKLKKLVNVRSIINPNEYMKKIKEVFISGVKSQVISKEYAKAQINKIEKELLSPSKFGISIRDKIEKAKKRLNEN